MTRRFEVDFENNKPNISLNNVIYAINIMSNYTPKATCLTRALAAQILLTKYHYLSTLKIGVSKKNDQFEAHAWLEVNNEVVLGQSGNNYAPILKMGEKS